ncbi:MAG: hypothetical protein C0402_01710 [Thermodesulfovibrio sp.]|nr:hypothetical protein [Thermodesulfovibrio sp.]
MIRLKHNAPAHLRNPGTSSYLKRREGELRSQRGVTLIELIVTVAIVAVITLALGFQFQSWKARYDVERTIRDVYTALTDARTRALQLSRAHFFDISPDGRHCRVTDDNSNGVAIVPNGDGIFQMQTAWAAVQASNPLNWGAPVATTDATLNLRSRRIDLPLNPGGASAAARAAGLLSGRNVVPGGGSSFVLGFDKRGIIRDMRATWAVPITNIELATAFPTAQGGGLTICIFTDYDNNAVSDSDPDYDCINIIDTKISLGKLTTQNTVAGGDCVATNCISK